MKLTYCIHSIYNPGGMERVLLNKVTYLKNKMGWDVSIVTTDSMDAHRSIRFPKAWKSPTWESIILMTTIKARF